MMSNKPILAVVLSFAFYTATAQEVEVQEMLSKEVAVQQMLVNNFGIQLANNQTEIAANNQGILNSGYLPTISGLAGGSYNNSDSTTDFNADSEGAVRPSNVINDAETRRYNASINLEYTLFDGLGRMYTYKRLKEEYNLSKLAARETIETTILQLFSVYYEVARLTENEQALQEALHISKEREKRAEYQFQYGQVSKLAVLNARVDITTDSVNVLNAQQQLRNAKRDLNLVLNRDLEQPTVVDTTVIFTSPLLIDSYIEKTNENNVRLLQAQQNMLISEYSEKSSKSFLLPSLGLTGSYGWNGAENPPSAFFPGTTASTTALNVGLNLRWNLFDGGRSITAMKNAKISTENILLQQEQEKKFVLRDLANARGNLNNALYIYSIQEQNVNTAKDNFNRSEERFKLGQINNVEFRQAQLNLLNAETAKNTAKYTAKLAELELLQLTGQLLNVDF
jgi:outer membrane protein TolC